MFGIILLCDSTANRICFVTALFVYCVVRITCLPQNITTATAKCKREYLYGLKGTISSPGFPVSYSNHTSCTWHIFAKSDQVVTISFDDVDIEDDTVCDNPPCCNYNWLKIGPTLNSRGRKYCGRKGFLPPPFFSLDNYVWIKFHISNKAKGGRGFQLSYIISSTQAKYCGKDEFHCSDSRCILSRWQCNRYNECKDGSDERFCKDQCPQNFLPCLSGIQCYSADKHCDGKADCADLSDELDCTYCGKNKIRCGLHSLQCFDVITERCNRILDCKNGEDEKGCFGCEGKISCFSGHGCYSWDERCNGIAKCGDFSDEKNCGEDLCNSERGGFLCRNGHCIREIWKCDHTNDCGDGSDEENCLRNSVISAAVMGSLVCGLLLVVAVGCTCRLYSLRFVEQRVAARDTQLSQFLPDAAYPEPPPSYTSSVECGSWLRGLGYEAPPARRPRSGRRRPRPSSPSSDRRTEEEEATSGPSDQVTVTSQEEALKGPMAETSEDASSSDVVGDSDWVEGDRRPLITERY